MTDALSWDVDGKAWPHCEASQFVTSGDLTWHVQIKGQGPDLLLLHGTGASSHTWRACIPILSKVFRVIAFDLPGHGFTSRASSSSMSLPGIAAAVSDLMCDLRRDKQLSPVCVVGHSAGAAIALRMILNGNLKPRAVVSLNGALLPHPGFGLLTLPMMFKAMFSNPFAAPIAAEFSRVTGNIRRAIANTGAELSEDGFTFYEKLFADRGHVEAAVDMMAQWDLAPLRKDLGRLDVPLTAVFGTDDLAIPSWQAEELASLLPATALVDLSGCGHIAPEEKPKEVCHIIVTAAQEVDLVADV